ncbi:MAG: bifunctional riboflavin kinase/FAD synthetase [Actinomycetota bacterium]
MKIFYGMEGLPDGAAPAAATIGNFYAVHRGHQALIERVLALAEQHSAKSTVVTFEPHPQMVLRGQAPDLLITAETKIELLAAAGIEQLWILPFTREFSLIEPEEFIQSLLVGRLNLNSVVVGGNFRFGHLARGNVRMLRSFGQRFRFEVQSPRLRKVQGRTVSSTAVRHALKQGDLEWANQALGRAYCLAGSVVRGAGRGEAIGYPTANLLPEYSLCVPGPGIYAGHVLTGGGRMVAAMSIGSNPTFGEGEESVEAYILDFDGDLYGREAEFEFNHRIRDHIQFQTPADLTEAISEDVAQVRRFEAR